MNTFAFELATSLDERWQEVDLLIEEANNQSGKKNLFDAICRSSVVLIVAHFEGFLKDAAKAIVDDINLFSSFKEAPEVIKRTYCHQFMDISESKNEGRIKKLIETFDGLETKFRVEPFLFEDNKNPSPTVLGKIAKNFGERTFFKNINESRLDLVFSGTKSDVDSLLIDLIGALVTGTKEYPYKINLSDFGIGAIATKSSERSFWETFLDQLLEKRHAIAHGTSIGNSLSIEEISDFKNKIQVLQRAFLLVLCDAAIKKPKPEETTPPKKEPPPTKPA